MNPESQGARPVTSPPSNAREVRRSRWRFRLAAPSDDLMLRGLLGAQALPGWVTLGFERQPSYFYAAGVEGERHQVLLAFDAATGRPAGMHSRAVRRVYLNGRECLLGHTGQLRVDPALGGGFRAYDLLRKGFAVGRAWLHGADEAPFDLTSILADNRRARRLLTSRLPGLPIYAELTGFNTLVLQCRWRRVVSHANARVRQATAADLPAISRFLQATYRGYQFAPVWDETALRSPALCRGLSAHDFLLAERSGELLGCLAVWDQRAFKQTVVRGYRPSVARVRLVYNTIAPAFGLPRLPAVGSALRQAWLSHVAGAPQVLGTLVRTALCAGRARGLDQLMLGLADSHPLLPVVKRNFRHLTYRSTLYLVHWSEQADALGALDGRPVHVELATL